MGNFESIQGATSGELFEFALGAPWKSYRTKN